MKLQASINSFSEKNCWFNIKVKRTFRCREDGIPWQLLDKRIRRLRWDKEAVLSSRPWQWPSPRQESRFQKTAKKPVSYCYTLNGFVPSKIICSNLISQSDGIWKWGLGRGQLNYMVEDTEWYRGPHKRKSRKPFSPHTMWHCSKKNLKFLGRKYYNKPTAKLETYCGFRPMIETWHRTGASIYKLLQNNNSGKDQITCKAQLGSSSFIQSMCLKFNLIFSLFLIYSWFYCHMQILFRGNRSWDAMVWPHRGVCTKATRLPTS